MRCLKLIIEIMQVQAKMVLQSARKLKSACKYYLKKVIPDRRQKCLIYGNCQTMALMNVLRSWQAFNDCYQILSIPPVFKIQPWVVIERSKARFNRANMAIESVVGSR